jgi:hypothetical protein
MASFTFGRSQIASVLDACGKSWAGAITSYFTHGDVWSSLGELGGTFENRNLGNFLWPDPEVSWPYVRSTVGSKRTKVAEGGSLNW